MKYYMPIWDDKLDPSFDFDTDTYTPDRVVSADLYAHQLFQTPLYDGLLLSRAVIEKSKTNYEALRKQGAHKYLRLPAGLKVLGDCGAFSYVNDHMPKYHTKDVLEYYAAIGVDYGASVDHLVVESTYETEPVQEESSDEQAPQKRQRAKKPMSPAERTRRIQLTLDNARDFIEEHRRRGYSFTPIGVAQGDTDASYAQSVRALLDMGYRYLAVGGLARSTSKVIHSVLVAVKQQIDEFKGCSPNDVCIHVFGVAKLDLVSDLPNLGVTSIDSASYLRKAWLRSGQNYLGADGKWYTAIRVPQSHNPKVEEYVRTNGKSIDEVRVQERACLELLQQYGTSGLSPTEFDRLLDTLVEYDTYLLRLGDDGQNLRNQQVSRDLYRRTLEAKPWEHCPCDVCKALGVHVLVFRGTNRNKRRGFHNTWTFYQRLKNNQLA